MCLDDDFHVYFIFIVYILSDIIVMSSASNMQYKGLASDEEPQDDGPVEEIVDDSATKEDDEPIPSGTGSVSKDCSASELLGWSEILPRWHNKLELRPKGLIPLVRCGIPEPLRGEVWQLLSGAHQSINLMDRYRILLTQSAPSEQIILRDVHRTYPAHENFRTDGGSSSLLDSLFKVCKAYAVYDEEVGYCQGLSFLVAALLLHMPEEQAFCVFVRIMEHYGLRNLFRNNFDELYLKFYQLEQLLAEHIPDLFQHFNKIGVEPFTYASQWFLTVFTAKFPLNAVFYIMDIFLLDGMDTIFQIALALLRSSKQELLTLDFEGVLKYFRVQMPKRYRSQEYVQQLINTSADISLKKLKKHAKNYEVIKAKEKSLENPVARLMRENTKLTENNLRLEQENDDLARDLVASKIQLRAQLDSLEERLEAQNQALANSHQECLNHASTISDMEDEKVRLEVEVGQLKEVCRRELTRAESEISRNSTIVSDYKNICSQLSKRLDQQMRSFKEFIETSRDQLCDNEDCKEKSCYRLFKSNADEFIASLEPEDNKSGNISNQSLARDKTPQGSPNVSSSSTATSGSSGETRMQLLNQHINDLEVELARTKLALVEAECKCQQLTHDLNVSVTVRNTPESQAKILSGKFDSVKNVVTTSSAFARFNNLFSEKISNLGEKQNQSLSASKSSVPIGSAISQPTFPVLRSPISFAGQLTPSTYDNDDKGDKVTIDKNQNQC